MIPHAQLPMRFEQARRIRQSKKQRIYAMFEANLGHRFKSNELHELFGTAFRTRCSEINLDPESKDCDPEPGERRRQTGSLSLLGGNEESMNRIEEIRARAEKSLVGTPIEWHESLKDSRSDVRWLLERNAELLEALELSESTLAAMYRIVHAQGISKMSDGSDNWVVQRIRAAIAAMEKP